MVLTMRHMTAEEQAEHLDKELARTNPALYQERLAYKAQIQGSEFWKTHRRTECGQIIELKEADPFDYSCIGASSELTA